MTLYGSDDARILEGALELCRRYGEMLDRHSPDSEVARLNESGGGAASPELYELLEKALYYCAVSDGAYDITVAPVMDLWDFKAEEPRAPSREEVESALKRVGWKRVVLSGGDSVSLLEGARLDLGSIAKGYIADRIAAYLREEGVPGAIVNLGGNVMAVGSKAGGKPFEIGIQKPFEDGEEIVGSLRASDLSLVSAGVYQRFFYLDEVLYHHIIDPATGYPVQGELVSVTVICPSSADADALSTLCFLLGTQRGLALVEGLPETEAVFLSRDGSTVLSSGLEGKYKEAA